MDADTGGTGGDSGSGVGAHHSGDETGGGGVTHYDFATGDCMLYVAEYREFVSEMEEIINANAGILPDVLIIIRGVAAGGVCDYFECEGWVYVDARGGGGDFPAVFLVETDEDVWDDTWYDQYEDTGAYSEAAGGKPGDGEFAAGADEGEYSS